MSKKKRIKHIKVKLLTENLLLKLRYLYNHLRMGELPPLRTESSSNAQCCPICGNYTVSLRTRIKEYFLIPDERFSEFYCMNCHYRWEQRQ